MKKVIFSIFLLLFLCINIQAERIIEHNLFVNIDPSKNFINVIDTVKFPKSIWMTEDSSFAPAGFYIYDSMNIVSIEFKNGFVEYEVDENVSPLLWVSDSSSEKYYEKAKYIKLNLNQSGFEDKLDLIVKANGVYYNPPQEPSKEYPKAFGTTIGNIEERGAFLMGQSFWYPSLPDVYHKFRMIIDNPEGWHTVTQGRLSIDPVFGYEIWDCDDPMEEIYFISGKYFFYKDRTDDIDVFAYIYEDDKKLASDYLKATIDYIGMYSVLIGKYPYPKFALVENYWQTGYGMPSFTLLGSKVIRLPFIIMTSYGHEILHNWWGNGVFVDSERGNWCEGLTTYLADHYYKQIQGPEFASDFRFQELSAYTRYYDSEKDFPLKDFRERYDGLSQAIGYGKSLFLFHMLKRQIGESNFYSALKKVYNENLFKKVSWDTFRDAFEFTSKKDLDSYFDQWVLRKSAPFLVLDSVWIESNKKYKINISIHQEADSIFSLLIPVKILYENNEKIIDFELNSKDTIYSIFSDIKPLKIQIDPYYDVFRFLDDSEIPASIGLALTRKSAVVFIPSYLSDDKRNSYKDIFNNWYKEAEIIFLSDTVSQFPDFSDKAVWFIGIPSVSSVFFNYINLLPAKIELVNDSLKLNKNVIQMKEQSFMITGKNLSEKFIFVYFNLVDFSFAESIKNKIPHYSKYSYLSFEKDKNILKGEWEKDSSILSWTF